MAKEHTKYLIPKPGLLVHLILPNKQEIRLPEAGAWVDWVGPIGRYWRRRVKDGSCVIGKPPAVEKIVQPTEEAETRRGRGKGRDD